MPFDEVIGHARPIGILRRMLQAGNMPHAFLFSGIAGVGKHFVATGFVRALNCTVHADDFCGTCVSCKKIARGMHPDFFQVAPEKNVIKIEQIRTLQQDIAFAPLEGAWRVVVIDRAECMNAHAANCLLKTLEEPPPNTVLVLVAHGSARLLPTVLSRCQKIVFAPLGRSHLTQLLAQQGIDDERARVVVPHAHGSLQRARYLLDEGLMDGYEKVIALLLEPGGVQPRLELARALSAEPEHLPILLALLQEWFRDVLLCRQGVGTERMFNADRADLVQRAAEQFEQSRLKRRLAIVQRLEQAYYANADMQLGLESLLL